MDAVCRLHMVDICINRDITTQDKGVLSGQTHSDQLRLLKRSYFSAEASRHTSDCIFRLKRNSGVGPRNCHTSLNVKIKSNAPSSI